MKKRIAGRTQDLTKGPVMSSMLRFALPMILGSLLQQCYNIVDTLIVGRFLGSDALAAVGSSFTLMVFVTSIILGLCMGSSAVFSIRFGRGDGEGLKNGVHAAFALILCLTLVLTLLSYFSLDGLKTFLRVPAEVWPLMRQYLAIIFAGIFASFLYNFFSSLLRSLGDSLTPLLFLAASAILNIALDLVFILVLKRGVAGAAEATLISEYASGIGLAIYSIKHFPELVPRLWDFTIKRNCVLEIAKFSLLTCVQQSVMNFGILLVQGVVNGFGATVMAAFAIAVKIDSFAYVPMQDYGNAFSTFIAQNYGACETERIKKGVRNAFLTALGFGIFVSVLVFAFAEQLMGLFVSASEAAVIMEGARYLRIEGAFYCGIGILFLLYGLYRAVEAPGISVVLTVISLGTRVVLAYWLSAIPSIGVVGIWWAVPIGWFLADMTGIAYFFVKQKRK